MTVESILAQARERTEATRMTETVEVGTFTEAVDPDTLATTRTLGATVYADKGQVKYPSATVSESTAAGQQVGAVDIILKIPVGAGPNIRAGHLVRVTASTVDASLVTREFRVKAWPQSGQVSAHRYPLEELS